MESILAQLPDWSQTVNPKHKLNCDGLKSAALRFLDSLPEIRQRYQLTESSKGAMLNEGVAAYIISRFEELDPGIVYSEEEFAIKLKSTIGIEHFERFKHLIFRHTELWRAQIKSYSQAFCFPELDLKKASALYLFFRVVFDLPQGYPRSDSKVFGGWVHPSAFESTSDFDLSWPVDASALPRTLTVRPFINYLGLGYDAIGEYDYFVERFKFRDKHSLHGTSFLCIPN